MLKRNGHTTISLQQLKTGLLCQYYYYQSSVFFMEALNKGSYFSMSIMIAYALIVINTLSSLFDTIEDRSGVAKELNIPINKRGKILTFLKTKLK